MPGSEHTSRPNTTHRKTHAVLGHAVHLSVHPGRVLLAPFRAWFEKRYAGKYQFARTVYLTDLALIGTILTLFVLALFMLLVPQKQFRDDILLTATIAPKEVVSGGSSTLVITYQNNTTDTLNDPRLTLSYPKHFFLQSISHNGQNIGTGAIVLKPIPENGTGTIHIKGVLFGDVGGEQAFKTTLSFAHGAEVKTNDQKTVEHVFSPTRSTLALDLTLPERAISSQPFSGIIAYKNTGSTDIREVRIQPEWPEGFTFRDASTQIRNGAFVLTNVKAGTEGQIAFTGTLKNIPSDLPFVFHPSFVFQDDVYKQETLTRLVPVLPAQIELSAPITDTSFTPGTKSDVRVHYKHIGQSPLQNVRINLTSRDAFLKTTETKEVVLATLNPGDEGDATFTVSVQENVETRLLTAYEQLKLRTKATVTYALASDPEATLSTTSAESITPLTTPLVFESFGRFTSPEGDQLGRGALPPRVGQKTSYWIFWNIDGTTNPLQNVQITGKLPKNVRATGKQTSSESRGVTIDMETRTVSWNPGTVSPTRNPLSQVFSAAFEVEIIPETAQIGSNAPLLTNIFFSGTDTFTGAALTRSLPNVTTNLPNDRLAKNKGLVK